MPTTQIGTIIHKTGLNIDGSEVLTSIALTRNKTRLAKWWLLTFERYGKMYNINAPSLF